MKKIVLFIAFIVVVSHHIEAQLGGRGGRNFNRQPVNSQPRQAPKFDVKQAIGLTIYEIDRVMKRINMKEKDKNYKKVVTVFNRFNKDQRDLSRINSFQFTQAEDKVNKIQEDVLKNGADYTLLTGAYKEVGEKFKPLTEQIKEKEKTLDADLKPLLSAKQFKKWTKLKAKIKKKG
jgi:transcription termination factor NusB